jgi:hypothetical protein
MIFSFPSKVSSKKKAFWGHSWRSEGIQRCPPGALTKVGVKLNITPSAPNSFTRTTLIEVLLALRNRNPREIGEPVGIDYRIADEKEKGDSKASS